MRHFARTLAGVLILALGLLLGPAVAVASSQPPNVGLRDDDATICARTAKTVTAGLDAFVAQMEDVTKKAASGDLSGAQAAVKQAGTTLTELAPKLRADADKAETPKLAETLDKLAAEFESLGKSLHDLSSLENFSTDKLDKLADTMSGLCGRTPSVSPTLPLPAAPTATLPR